MHRTLDDLPIVTSASSPLGPAFHNAYTSLCKRIGASLAKPCPAKEKAFNDSKIGTVLGIRFNTSSMSWSISDQKVSRILHLLQAPYTQIPVNLNHTQKLIGLLNDLSQMCPFLKGFKHNVLDFLQSFHGNEETRLIAPHPVVADLHIWAAAALSAARGLPIPGRPTLPRPGSITFVSDAAGAQFAKVQGRFIPILPTSYRGAASINHINDTSSDVWFCCRLTWPTTFLMSARDTSDHAFGCKSSTLEVIALILPFLCIPNTLKGRDVILLTDNESVVFGWLSRRIQHDITASLFIRALHIISTFLDCQVTIRHLPRMSTPSAILADQLTRGDTTQAAQLAAIASSPIHEPPDSLMEWLANPQEDWNLPMRLLDSVQSKT